MTSEDIPPEVVKRMANHLRRVVTNWSRVSDEKASEELREAREIVALLPPIDPDVLATREYMASTYQAGADKGIIDRVRAEYRAGTYDDTDYFKHTLGAIKLGRDLAAKED